MGTTDKVIDYAGIPGALRKRFPGSDALRLGAARQRLRTVKKLVGNAAPLRSFPTVRKKKSNDVQWQL